MMTVMRIIMPPKIRRNVMLSSRINAASTTVTTGSMVERVAAFVGPMRSRPAKNVTIARTLSGFGCFYVSLYLGFSYIIYIIMLNISITKRLCGGIK